MLRFSLILHLAAASPDILNIVLIFARYTVSAVQELLIFSVIHCLDYAFVVFRIGSKNLFPWAIYSVIASIP
jgi:hypothetical protein